MSDDYYRPERQPMPIETKQMTPKELAASIKRGEKWKVAEPVQEPVAWIHTDPDKPRVTFLEWRDDEPGYRGRWIKTPLYTTPPQRLPLTEEEITQCFKEAGITIKGQHWTNAVRNVERAHGIGGEA